MLVGCSVRKDLTVNNLSTHLAKIYVKGIEDQGKPDNQLIAIAQGKQQQLFAKAVPAGAMNALVVFDENNKPMKFKVKYKDDGDGLYMEIRDQNEH